MDFEDSLTEKDYLLHSPRASAGLEHTYPVTVSQQGRVNPGAQCHPNPSPHLHSQQRRRHQSYQSSVTSQPALTQHPALDRDDNEKPLHFARGSVKSARSHSSPYQKRGSDTTSQDCVASRNSNVRSGNSHASSRNNDGTTLNINAKAENSDVSAKDSDDTAGGGRDVSARDNDVSAGSKSGRMAMLTLVTFLYSCAGRLHGPIMTQYAYQVFTDRVYGNQSLGVHVSKDPCLNESMTDPRADQVQDKVADLLMQLDLVSGSISICINLLLGSYSDVLGRRFLLLVPLAGHFLRNAMAPVVIHWDLGLSALYASYVMDGLCGGSSGVALGLYVYAADITRSDRQRTVGMAVVDTVIGVTTAVANTGAGYFIQDTGFFYPSLTSALLLLTSIGVVVCFLPETVPRDRKRFLWPAEGARRVFSIYWTRGLKYQRSMLGLGLLAFLVAQLPAYADNKVRTLYLMDRPFCWSSIDIGFFFAATEGGSRVAGLLFIAGLQSCLPTALLAAVGALSALAGDVLMGLARTALVVYVGVPVVSMAGTMMFPCIRSIMSRMVPPDRQGALFASIAVAESVCYATGQLFFLSLYNVTRSTMPGMIFFIESSFHLTIIVIMAICLCLLRRVVPSQGQSISVQTVDVEDS